MESEAQSVAARLSVEVSAGRLQPDASQADAARRLDRLSDHLGPAPSLAHWLRSKLPRAWSGTAPPAARGLYLWGGVGRGKTLLMDMFYATLQSAQRVTVERSHFYRFMRQVHAGLRAAEPRERPLDGVAEHLAARARVICLDELIVTDIADAMILGGLFEGLFRRGVTLVATSNIAPQDLYEDGLQRLRFLPAIALLQAHMDVLHLDGGIDYRLRRLSQAPIYLDSGQSSTAQRMRERFAALAGDSAAGPSTLRIEDRAIATLASGPGMVWFAFGELCAGPRGPNDYIELARQYHTIFISDIPELTAADDDAARRCIAAIDEFYDRGVKLVVSAAAAPAALYRGERLQREFERAASRLTEMQTQDYLARPHLA